MKMVFNVKKADEKRVLDAFDAAYGGREAGKNPVSKEKWVKLQVTKFVKDIVEGHEVAKANAKALEEVKVKELKLE